MKIGIIVAMDKELNLLLPLLEDCRHIQSAGLDHYEGLLDGTPVVVAKCGIGKVNSAITALTLIDRLGVDMIINTGVAGGTGSDAGILDIVVGDRIAYHDTWCGPGTTPGQAAECPLYFTNPAIIDRLRDLPGVKTGLIASGDIFVAYPDDLERILRVHPDAMAVDMESASIAHVCHLRGVPFVSIRVVSDTPGKDNNISQYENFWTDAPERTFRILKEVLPRIKEI